MDWVSGVGREGARLKHCYGNANFVGRWRPIADSVQSLSCILAYWYELDQLLYFRSQMWSLRWCQMTYEYGMSKVTSVECASSLPPCGTGSYIPVFQRATTSLKYKRRRRFQELREYMVKLHPCLTGSMMLKTALNNRCFSMVAYVCVKAGSDP